jgi:hypothetical protein
MVRRALENQPQACNTRRVQHKFENARVCRAARADGRGAGQDVPGQLANIVFMSAYPLLLTKGGWSLVFRALQVGPTRILAEYLSESGMKWMCGGAKRQCDRALPPGYHAGRRRRDAGLPSHVP